MTKIKIVFSYIIIYCNVFPNLGCQVKPKKDDGSGNVSFQHDIDYRLLIPGNLFSAPPMGFTLEKTNHIITNSQDAFDIIDRYLKFNRGKVQWHYGKYNNWYVVKGSMVGAVIIFVFDNKKPQMASRLLTA